MNADVDPSTAKSRTGYVVAYGGCPLVWASKLQTEVALSTTEAEYNAMSASLREVIHLMQLVDEAKMLGWATFVGKPVVHCKVYEDNSGALEMARLPKMRPRTKHLCVRLHHFKEHVRKGLISIVKVMSEDQLADILTKPQSEVLFRAQRETLMNWNAEIEPGPVSDLIASHLRACDIRDPGQDRKGGNQPDTATPVGPRGGRRKPK